MKEKRLLPMTREALQVSGISPSGFSQVSHSPSILRMVPVESIQ
jgi:hypothetical protein